jgi:choline dehydrogenase-like flavoprotein
MMVYVIGSGPAGVAAAHALIAQGIEVTMLDVGIELETEKQVAFSQLHGRPQETWDPKLIAQLKGGMRADTGGLPEKRTYGSAYPFRDAGQSGWLDMQDTEVLVSGAKGGLSNVWGANLMPYAQRDLAGWPITANDLAPHYKAVASFVPMSAGHDDLEEFFPIFAEKPTQLRPSRQAVRLMENLQRHRAELRAHGFVAGYSRMAVQVDPTGSNSYGCVYCGLCLYGCPHRLIYSSSHTVRELERHNLFHYVPGVVVEKLAEHADHVEILARARDGGTPQKFIARRIYVACGTVATTKLLLESMQGYDTPVVLKDSQYFLFPMLQYECIPRVQEEPLHTLAQAYIEIFDDTLSARTIQLQFYTYNDLFAAAVREKAKFFHPLLKPLLPALLGRLSVMMGYLHSDDSSALMLTLRRSGTGTKLHVQPIHNEKARRIIDGVLRKMWRHRSLFRAAPIKPLLNVCVPGKSYHYGGTFPMSRQPGRGESDLWGRPAGFQRIHAVDASVLPSIAATTIVFTAMANAHRIASACKEME